MGDAKTLSQPDVHPFTKALLQGQADCETERGRHADAIARMWWLGQLDMAAHDLEFGLQLLKPLDLPGPNLKLFLSHAKVVVETVCSLAALSSGGRDALEALVECATRAVHTLHDLDAEHPGVLASFPRDERFFPPVRRRKNFKRVTALVIRFVWGVERLQERMKSAFSIFEWAPGPPPAEPLFEDPRTGEYLTANDYLIKVWGFTPGQVALKDIPPFTAETEPIWWEQAALPYLEQIKERIKGTPLWRELKKGQEDYEAWDDLKHRFRSALRTLAKRRRAPQN